MRAEGSRVSLEKYFSSPAWWYSSPNIPDMSAIFILNSDPKCGLFKKSINLKSGMSFEKSVTPGMERLEDVVVAVVVVVVAVDAVVVGGGGVVVVDVDVS